MKKKITFCLLAALVTVLMISFRDSSGNDAYMSNYNAHVAGFVSQITTLQHTIAQSDLQNEQDLIRIKSEIQASRNALKKGDIWFRYLEPNTYRKINGPLPVEWETEVFEKFEKPYRREGAGLTLAALYLEEAHPVKDTLLSLINTAIAATAIYNADSITKNLNDYHHFYLCNRLFLLNLAAIYATGFECPDTNQIIPELRLMLADVYHTYQSFNESFPGTPIPENYLRLYRKAIDFCNAQTTRYTGFDHFSFIKDYINPLYAINQQLILDYKVVSRSMVDYSLNKNATSIFSKDVYNGQNSKGIFLRIKDTAVLAEIDKIGKLLFYDPLLSGNNMRSCASCHQPTRFFTDTMRATHFQYNHKDFLARNTPSLINAGYNHLIMADGLHFTLQNQTKAVITNPIEMGCTESEALRKVMSCKTYKTAFTKLLAYTPQETEVTFDHIASAITFYYGKFSKAAAPFDNEMNRLTAADEATKHGFNLFMSKAQCGTCHFVPQFNGVKPPFIGSEFEVLGVPADTGFRALSADKGRFNVNPAMETMNAFRTGSLRNAANTAPYMHNGVFTTLSQVIDFYDAGGGVGRGLHVSNQTLSADSLHLTKMEKADLLHFINSLNEAIPFEQPPVHLPTSAITTLNRRQVGGVY